METQNHCWVSLTRVSKKDIINKYSIDYIAVKKYYNIESEDEVDYSVINNNIYDKCINSEKCRRLKTLFTDNNDYKFKYKTNTLNKSPERVGQKKRGRKKGWKKCGNNIDINIENIKKKLKLIENERQSDCFTLTQKTYSNEFNRFITTTNTTQTNNITNSDIVIRNENLVNEQTYKTNNTGLGISDKKIRNEKSLKGKKSNKKSININTNKRPKLKANNLNKNIKFTKTDNTFNGYKTFMGSRYQKNDLINVCNECENGCQVDELTLAFHLMMTSSEDSLPRDLNLKLNIESDSSDGSDDEVISTTNKTLNNSDDLNVFPTVDEIFKQTIEENFQSIDPIINSEIDNFFINTNVPIGVNQTVIK